MFKKEFKKFISIFVIAMFVLSIIPMSISAANLSYGTSKAASIPWTGDNIPSVRMVNSAGTASVVSGDTSTNNLSITSVMEFTDGVYGKASSDLTYKTYDYATRTSVSPWSGGDIRFSGNSSSGHPDRVLEFSFAYEKSGTSVNANYAKDTLIQSCIKVANIFDESTFTQVSNLFYAEKTGLLFTPNDNVGNANSNDVTGEVKKKFNFEPNTWYKVSLVFDFENKATSSDTNLQDSYTYKAFVNGHLVSSQTLNDAFYDLNYICINPQMGSVMYWDNINYYSIDSAGDFNPANTPAELASTSESVVVENGAINLKDVNAKVSDVTAAIQSSLKTNETVRVYNSDYTQELDADSAALGAKVVVAGTEALTSSITAENIYTYYDIGIDGGYAFDEASIAIADSKAQGTVKLYNYSGEAQSFKGYLAVYDGTELVALKCSGEDFGAAADETEKDISVSGVSYEEGNEVKFFVWKADGITPEVMCKYPAE